MACDAEIAQLVEHATENRSVRSPILRLGTQAKNGLHKATEGTFDQKVMAEVFFVNKRRKSNACDLFLPCPQILVQFIS